MTTYYTLHTDESGTFESIKPSERPLVAGVLLPWMPKKDLKEMRETFCNLAAQYGIAPPYLKNLHAGASNLSYKKRDRLCQEMVDATISLLPEGKPLRVVSVIYGSDGPTSIKKDFASPAFAANRYQAMLLELVRQVLGLVPGPETSDEVELHLASRVFPVSPREAKDLKPLGYTSFSDKKKKGTELVRVGDVATLRSALQGVLVMSNAPARAVPTRLEIESIEKSSDPRFHLVDFLANALGRNHRVLEFPTWRQSLPLRLDPRLEITILWTGKSLNALTRASEALRRREAGLVLDALASTEHPATHQALVERLFLGSVPLARNAVSRDPMLARYLVERAKRLLDHRVYARLRDVERAARVVAEAEKVGEQLRAKAFHALGTACNHRGDVQGAITHIEKAISLMDLAPSTFENFLGRLDMENSRAVVDMNRFAFEAVLQRLAPFLERTERILDDALGKGAKERVVGEIARTLAQAACHLEDWGAADRFFRVAGSHLGEDHMQASFRAHAAIDRGGRDDAIQWSGLALGSEYQKEGWNIEEGLERLDHPVATLEASFRESKLFNAWLIVKLAARGWIDDAPQVARVARELLFKHRPQHFPAVLVYLGAGQAMLRCGDRLAALETWQRGWKDIRVGRSGRTLRVLRLQLPASLQLHGHRRKSNQKSWQKVVTDELGRLSKEDDAVAAYFREPLVALEEAGADEERGRAALSLFLERFTFLNH